jgi:peroxiredoxin
MHKHLDLADTAPDWRISNWLNTARPLQLGDLRGQIVLLHAFQMLCPGCVSHGLPQALRVQEAFAGRGVQVIGLHSVFEHHAAMTETSLRAFVQEYRLDFPIGIDAPVSGSPIPATMAAYGLQGTPSLLLIDRSGRRRLQHFGRLDDLRLGALLGQLLQEASAPDLSASRGTQTPAGCDQTACPLQTAG